MQASKISAIRISLTLLFWIRCWQNWYNIDPKIWSSIALYFLQDAYPETWNHIQFALSVEK